RDPLPSALCLFSAGAGAIHAIVTPEHLQEDVRFGVFFLVLTVAQLAWIVPVLRRSSTATWAMGGAGNLAVLAIWAASRTTGLPIGPHPWMAEPVGSRDFALARYHADGSLDHSFGESGLLVTPVRPLTPTSSTASPSNPTARSWPPG